MAAPLDFASIPYDEEPAHVRICLLQLNGTLFKVLLNPTDQLRALRLIVRAQGEQASGKPFHQVPLRIHQDMICICRVLTAALYAAGAWNVNVRYDGNNKFAEKPEKEGLHYHVLGRYPDQTLVLDTYRIQYPAGVSGDIALGTNKAPFSRNAEENAKLCSELCQKLRKLVVKEIADNKLQDLPAIAFVSALN